MTVVTGVGCWFTMRVLRTDPVCLWFTSCNWSRHRCGTWGHNVCNHKLRRSQIPPGRCISFDKTFTLLQEFVDIGLVFCASSMLLLPVSSLFESLTTKWLRKLSILILVSVKSRHKSRLRIRSQRLLVVRKRLGARKRVLRVLNDKLGTSDGMRLRVCHVGVLWDNSKRD